MRDPIPLLLPANSFRGGECIPMWSNSDHRIFRFDRRCFIVEQPCKLPRVKNVSKDVPGVYLVDSSIVLNNFIYVKCHCSDPTYHAVLIRYNLNDLKQPGTIVPIFGQPIEWAQSFMTCDGNYFYFTHKAGHSKIDFEISKYTLSEEGLSYVGDIVCGDTPNVFTHIVATPAGMIYALHWYGGIHKFNSDGAKISLHKPYPNSPKIRRTVVISNHVYVNTGSDDRYLRLIELE